MDENEEKGIIAYQILFWRGITTVIATKLGGGEGRRET
jgi:hypothetical protein